MSYTPEDNERWTRQLAEIDGWYADDEWKEFPNYQQDINAINRVCRRICETGVGSQYLMQELLSIYEESWEASLRHPFVWLACLTAEELFEIIGRTTDQLKESK